MTHKKKMEILEAVWRESSNYFKQQARQKERMMKLVSLNDYYAREKYRQLDNENELPGKKKNQGDR